MNTLLTYFRLSHFRRHWFWYLVNLIAIIPLAWLLWDYFLGNLSVNPIKDITLRTGAPALWTLFASLACTPINTATGWRIVNTVRKSLGLQAFLYASLHLLTFVGLDYGFSWEFIVQDGIAQKPYILVGLAAFLILLPLAITSTQGWQKRLGKQWKKLHRAVYVAGIFAAVHFFWLARASDLRPLLYGAILTVLLVARIPAVRSWLASLRGKGASPKKSTEPLRNRTVRAAAVPVTDQK